jgi:hypothetical protein
MPCPPFLSSRKVVAAEVEEAGIGNACCGVRLPVSSAASAMKGLKVEPGG